MGNEHLTDQAASAERHAHTEWQSLLARLNAPRPAEVRLERLRHAIARGEFQVDARAIAARLIARFLTS